MEHISRIVVSLVIVSISGGVKHSSSCLIFPADSRRRGVPAPIVVCTWASAWFRTFGVEGGVFPSHRHEQWRQCRLPAAPTTSTHTSGLVCPHLAHLYLSAIGMVESDPGGPPCPGIVGNCGNAELPRGCPLEIIPTALAYPSLSVKTV